MVCQDQHSSPLTLRKRSPRLRRRQPPPPLRSTVRNPQLLHPVRINVHHLSEDPLELRRRTLRRDEEGRYTAGRISSLQNRDLPLKCCDGERDGGTSGERGRVSAER